MSEPKRELRNTNFKNRLNGNAFWAAAIGIFTAVLLFLYAYNKGYITFNAQNSLFDIIPLIMALFFFTALVGLVFFQVFQFFGLRSVEKTDSLSKSPSSCIDEWNERR